MVRAATDGRMTENRIKVETSHTNTNNDTVDDLRNGVWGELLLKIKYVYIVQCILLLL